MAETLLDGNHSYLDGLLDMDYTWIGFPHSSTNLDAPLALLPPQDEINRIIMLDLL